MTTITVDGQRPEQADELTAVLHQIEGVRIFEGEITGMTPYLFNKYAGTDKEIAKVIGPKPADATKEDEWRRKEAYLRLYETDLGLAVPSRNIRACMVDGSKAGAGIKHRPGNKGTERAVWPFIRQGTIPEPTMIEFMDTSGRVLQRADVTLHGDMVRIPPVKGGLVRKYWPQLTSWMLHFRLVVFDPGLESDKHLLGSLRNGGIFCGLGTGKPDYGKFKVTDWQEVH